MNDYQVTTLSADDELRVMQLFGQPGFSAEELRAQLGAHDLREQAVFAELRRLTRAISHAAAQERVLLERQRADVLDSLGWHISRRERLESQLRGLA